MADDKKPAATPATPSNSIPQKPSQATPPILKTPTPGRREVAHREPSVVTLVRKKK